MLSIAMLEIIMRIFADAETLNAARQKKNTFIRKRGMPFPHALYFMLDMRKTTIQTRLNEFFRHNGGGRPISQQAFSKLRANFDHSPFEKALRSLVREEYSGKHPLTTWKGRHLLAVDGSYMQLPRTDELRATFGTRGEGSCPMAGVSVLFDVLHGWALDPILTESAMNERVQFEKHLDFLNQEHPDIAQNAIFMFDRGYPSHDLFKRLQESGHAFVARCKTGFSPIVDAAPIGSTIVTLKNGICVRVVKIARENGPIEQLVTNLFDDPTDDIHELYMLRWGIETMYFELKEKLCVEKFSGKSPNSIYQDFWASMLLLNSVAVFQQEADAAVKARQADKPLNHEYRARTSDLIITLRNRFIFAALCGHPTLTAWEMDDVISTLARVVSPIRPGRSFPRNFKPRYVVNHNLKSHL